MVQPTEQTSTLVELLDQVDTANLEVAEALQRVRALATGEQWRVAQVADVKTGDTVRTWTDAEHWGPPRTVMLMREPRRLPGMVRLIYCDGSDRLLHGDDAVQVAS